MTSRWSEFGGDRSSYDEAWKRLEASGGNPHGEADFVMSFAPTSVLDAGCGTGRVGIELGRRGVDVVGIDLDPSMLDQARHKAPKIEWVLGDLTTAALGREFDAVVAAGNVMIFLASGTEAQVVANLVGHLAPSGVLVTGFQIQPRGYSLERYDTDAAGAGLALVERWSTWDRAPFEPGGDYAVSVHRRPPN